MSYISATALMVYVRTRFFIVDSCEGCEVARVAKSTRFRLCLTVALPQISGEAKGHSRNFSERTVNRIEIASFDIPKTDRHVQMTLHLMCRTAGKIQEICKFTVTSTPVPLCHVRHYRDRCTTGLIPKAEIFSETAFIGQLINFQRDIISLLPSLNFLKTTKLTHGRSVPKLT